ncbi:MAG: DNA-processing protein DprA [Atopobiaceae bacterium]|jgi:DNA processing protein|nr:DNA-protecting protein DprA [Atopobiaceae bacterium]MCH4180042.1 DNA-protecting protein DprA [Atopobiaceae bacterium]MCH4213906.1 DNA-protecting protein DprA [Atopobiaceae bacterium]MCH4229844.1 DNA-protecting protein DprA [Atopobiaceae bacterium]MCH4275631.1 DNA-protecting protein DprA [Atopobiaceae bacterium]
MSDGIREMPDDGWTMAPSDDSYPPLARDAHEGSGFERIWGVGSAEVLSRPCVSVVGARRATPYGLAVAEMVGRVAAESGIVVVSGGAMGVDRAAGLAAVDAGGATVVVSGCGADVVYPRSSADVFDAARTQGGAVISLGSWGTQPRRYAFPKRNVLIAALSPVLVVTEAGLPSGTMSTAVSAAELGRSVYCAPGSIFSPNSRGTNQLLYDGARPFIGETTLQDMLEDDYRLLRLSPTGSHCQERGRILSALVASPARPDDLASRLGEGLLTILRTLSDYESRGLVTRLADGRYAASEASLLGHNGS